MTPEVIDNPVARAPIEFSIIVPTFNCESLVGGALESLAAQTFRDFEVVVSDGDSKDRTMTVVESYRKQLPGLQVRSERDAGVYDAMNRAIPLCKGRWILILGADDRLNSSTVLSQVAAALVGSTVGMAYGDVKVIGKNAMTSDGGRYGGRFTLARLLGQNICQQAIFYSPGLFRRIGGFNLRYRLWADWELAQRAFISERTQWLDLVVANYAATGMSSKNLDQAFRDSQTRRLFQLWVKRPWSLGVPAAMLRDAYWRLRKA